jgi:glycosyltransferase involved in cell wall biosynthesis
VLPFFLPPLRAWDRAAARRVTQFVAISSTVQSRIQKVYGRQSDVLFPPVEVDRFHPVDKSQVGDYYLIVSRLVPYKRVHLAVEAFNQLGLPLIIAGEGRDRPRLEKMAGANIRFCGRVSDAERREVMARCRAFIFPGEEDFGIAPLEANASGRPVIAYAGGGALDTLREGETGTLFREATADSLADAVRRMDPMAFDSNALRAHAAQFGVPVFQAGLKQRVEGLLAGI